MCRCLTMYPTTGLSTGSIQKESSSRLLYGFHKLVNALPYAPQVYQVKGPHRKEWKWLVYLKFAQHCTLFPFQFSLGNKPWQPCYVVRLEGITVMLDVSLDLSVLLHFLPLPLVYRYDVPIPSYHYSTDAFLFNF